MLAVGDRAVLAIDHRDDVLEQIALVECGVSAEVPGAFRRNPGAVAVDVRPSVAQRHDDQEWLDPLLCEQIVENVVRPPVPVPRMMIVREAVQEVEDRIAAISRLVVSRRNVDRQFARDAIRPRLVEQRPDLSVRHILNVVERRRRRQGRSTGWWSCWSRSRSSLAGCSGRSAERRRR